MNFIIFRLVIFLVHVIIVFALDENSVKERPCDIPTPPVTRVGLDYNWVQSIPIFFVPLWSKLKAQRIISDLLQKPVSEISENELHNRPACIINRQNHVGGGFGLEYVYNHTSDESGLYYKAPWAGAKSAKYTFHLTDNENFILGVDCYEDNQSGWGVLATTPYLEDSDRNTILNYIESIGFRRDFAVIETYVNCPLEQLRLQSNDLSIH